MPYKNKEKRKEAQKQHYLKNKDKFVERRQKRREINRKYIAKIRDESRCERCQEDHPACLDFHHVSNKSLKINRAIQDFTLEKLKEEIDKCVILCANCHRKHHFEEENQWSESKKIIKAK